MQTRTVRISDATYQRLIRWLGSEKGTIDTAARRALDAAEASRTLENKEVDHEEAMTP